jgi:dienelactone hydrolase
LLRGVFQPKLLLLTLASLHAGCATVEKYRGEQRARAPLPLETANRFCYEPVPVEADLSVRKEKRRYTIYDTTIEAGLPEFDDDSPITAEYYQPTGEGPWPVAIVLPILNGGKELVRPFATHFVKHGYAAIIVDTVQRKTLLEDLGHPELAIRQTVLRHRRVIDWAATRPELDTTRVVVFGASLGGFNAFLLAALDERVRAVAPALAAADLPSVLTTSNENRIASAIEAAKKDMGLDQAGMLDYLEQGIETDTSLLARHVDPERVLMVIAKYDKSVPNEKQRELREIMGQPAAIILPTGHVQSAAFIFQLRRKIRKFFDAVLELPGSGSVAVLPADRCAGSGQMPQSS